MSSETRRAKDQKLFARIDDVLTGHEHQRMYREIASERVDTIPYLLEIEPVYREVTSEELEREAHGIPAWERFCRALTSHWRDS